MTRNPVLSLSLLNRDEIGIRRVISFAHSGIMRFICIITRANFAATNVWVRGPLEVVNVHCRKAGRIDSSYKAGWAGREGNVNVVRAHHEWRSVYFRGHY